MKRFLTVALIFLLTCSLFAQNLWRQELDWLPSTEATYRPIEPIVYKNYIYVSHRYGDSLVVDQLGFTGIVLQRKFFASAQPGKCAGIFLAKTPQNNLKVVECVHDSLKFKVKVFEVDSLLQEKGVQSFQLSSQFSEPDFNRIKFFSDSSFAIMGRNFESNFTPRYPLLLYINAIKNIKNVKEYQFSGDGTLLFGDTFNFIGYGKSENEFIAGVGNLFMKLMTLDSNLNVVQDIELYPHGSSGLASFWPVGFTALQSNYVLSGLYNVSPPVYYQSGLTWLDSTTLLPLDSILLPNPTFTEKWFVRHCHTSDGGILAIDNQTYNDWTDPTEKRHITIHKIGVNHQINWVKTLPFTASYFHVGSASLPQGSAVVVNRFYKNGGYKLEVFTIDVQGNFMSIFENNNNYSNLIKVFPNPATTTLNIEGKNNEVEAVYFYDLEGRLVKTVHLDIQVYSIDISSLSKGCYLPIVKLKSGAYHSIDKIIKR